MAKLDPSTSPPATATSTQAEASEAFMDSNKQPSLNPDQITLPTFRHLLSRYPKTVEQVHRRKFTLKLQPKAQSAKRKAKDASTTQKELELDPSQEEHIRSETEKFIQLDKWRYEEMPSIIAERRASAKSKGEVSLSKEELIRIMEWKLKHGHFRPTLMGMIKSNAEKLVRECTSSAIALLPDHPASDSFAKASLDALAPLRGVGIATASVILSIVTAAADDGEVPFYSDDSFLWLCAGRYPGVQGGKKYMKPNGDLNVKYNVNEYRMLWDAMLGLQGRLNADVKEGPRVGLVDVERVAYVLSHFDEGIYEGEGDEQGNKKQKRAKGEDL